jgi:5-methylcytosine-specific restriction endonuclease McrA
VDRSQSRVSEASKIEVYRRRMQAPTNAAHSGPLAEHALERLSDEELLRGTRLLVGRSNQLLAELLAQLGEVEARGLHRTRACSSLYAYCTYELRFSEDEAFRRVTAARLARRFPVLLDALAAGELHLTGLLMLGSHLTEGNVVGVIARAKHRTKREIAALVRILDPLPAVPARIEPLGPAPARLVPPEPSWEAFIASTCPVRELAAGDRPREWMQSATDRGDGPMPVTATAPARVEPPADGPRDPERFKVQFTATEEYVHLVEEAKALLSHAVPNVRLEELQIRAMRALVAELRKKKYATTDRGRARPVDSRAAPAPSESTLSGSARGTAPTECASTNGVERADSREHAVDRGSPRQRGRHVPAAVRRAVFERDGGRCTYADATGARCAETHRLEFHHLIPFAAGGQHHASNLVLRCAAHNALAAEEDFGREFMAGKKAEGRPDAEFCAILIGAGASEG